MSPVPFVPTTDDVLAICSYEGPAGGSFNPALIFNPQRAGAGIIVDNDGRMADVPDEQWTSLQKLVDDAVNAIMDGVDFWSRPQRRSCPSTNFYDLRPRIHSPIELRRFTLSAHMVHGDKPNAILQYNEDGTREVVVKIPESIIMLEKLLSKLPTQLIASTESPVNVPDSDQLTPMLDALERIASVQRSWRLYNLAAVEIMRYAAEYQQDGGNE